MGVLSHTYNEFIDGEAGLARKAEQMVQNATVSSKELELHWNLFDSSTSAFPTASCIFPNT